MKRHVILWAIAIGILGGLVLSLVVVLTPVRRFPVGVVAVSEDEAILVTRFEDVAVSRHFIERVGAAAEGDGAWTVEMSPLLPVEGFDATGLVVAGARVVGQGMDGQQHDFAFALSRESGALIWQIQLPGVGGPDLGGRLDGQTMADEARAYLVHDVEVTTERGVRVVDRLDVVALDSGTIVWSATNLDVGRDRFDVEMIDGELILSGAGAHALRLDPATGARREELGFETVLCTWPGGVVGADGSALIIARRGAGRGGALRVELGDDADLAWTRTCGFRGGAVIVDVKRSFVPHAVRVALDSGAVVWDRALGPGTVLDGPLAVGDLPRLVPISLCGQVTGEAPNFCQIVVLDVDRGQVVARHQTPRAESVRPVTTPERAYVWVRHAGLWVALDGATGQLGDTWRMARFFDLELQEDDVANGRIWIAPRTVAHPGNLPWVVLDLAGDTIHARGGDVEIEAVAPGLDAATP